MKFKKKDILILVLIAAFVYIVVKTGILSKVKKNKIDSTSNAKDGSSPTYTANSAEYKNIARSVYESFEGQYLFWDDDTALSELKKLDNLPDADLIEVSNAFTDLYTTDIYKKSMKSLIQGEYLSGWESDNLRNEVVARLGDLNV